MPKAMEDEKFVTHGRWIFTEDFVDPWGARQRIARIHEQTSAVREKRLVALLRNAPRMLHLLLEIERKFFPMQDRAGLFDEIDKLVEEIEKAGEE